MAQSTVELRDKLSESLAKGCLKVYSTIQTVNFLPFHMLTNILTLK